jgi:hypothetical protein
MKLIKNKIKAIVTTLLVSLSAVSIFVLNSCECLDSNESLDFVVFAGDLSAQDCKGLMRENSSHPDITYICPGEKVTICWSSSAISQLTLHIGNSSHSVSASGSEVVAIDATTVIKLVPGNAKCVSTRTFTVKVISGPTTSTWDGRWDCRQIYFSISEAFMSKSIIARDIRAPWTPFVTVSNSSGTSNVACTTPPFLLGNHQEEGFGFDIKQPMVSVAFSRPLKAVGHWSFVLQAVCPSGDYVCNTYSIFPFDLTLDCPNP